MQQIRTTQLIRKIPITLDLHGLLEKQKQKGRCPTPKLGAFALNKYV